MNELLNFVWWYRFEFTCLVILLGIVFLASLRSSYE